MHPPNEAAIFQSIKNDLRSVSLFNNCDNNLLSTLAINAQYQTHNKGKILFLHDDKADRFYFIKKGQVKLFRETLDGVQAIANILDAGNTFGEEAIFDNNKYPYSAETIGEVEIISFSLSGLKKEIENNTKLSLNFLHSMAKHHRLQDKEIEHRSVQNASQRIGCFLLRLANQKQQPPVTINLPYDKTLIASQLGMQPETFSRALAKLKDKTGIRVKGSTIEMDNFEQLSNYSCASCSSEFPCKDL